VRKEGERDVPDLELHPLLGRVRVSFETERLSVELRGPLSVECWDRDEVDALYL